MSVFVEPLEIFEARTAALNIKLNLGAISDCSGRNVVPSTLERL
jgi:hypothetical protein